MSAANRAVALACQWMRQCAPGAPIHDVQTEPRFQNLGVDLLWENPNSTLGVEVKGDRSRGHRFFFELVSNFEKNTPGCFLYSKADWLLYVFLPLRRLYALPLPATRKWLLPLAPSFPLQKAHTRTGPIAYTTLGVCVPVPSLLCALPQITAWQQLDNQAFSPLPPPLPKTPHYQPPPPHTSTPPTAPSPSPTEPSAQPPPHMPPPSHTKRD